MRKKNIAIGLLYLAGIILLAFAVFPHHHHQSFICFNSSHCHSAQEEAHGHDTTFPVHTSNCIHYLLQTDQVKNVVPRLFYDQDSDGNLPVFHSFYYLSPEQISLPLLFGIQKFFPASKEQKLYVLPLSLSDFTRGPPVH